MKTLYKTLKTNLLSGYDSSPWVLGNWRVSDQKPKACNHGFHASVRIIDAMQYVNTEVLALAEVAGKADKEKDKEAWEKMRLVDAWVWEKKHSVMLSIFAANLVLENFEKVFPDDKRPRQAIEAAVQWLKKPTSKNKSAAWSAAWSAAESAAESAAWSARSAAWSARSAAESAAESAAAWSAESAAAESARSAAAWSAESADKILDKCEQYIISSILPDLKRYRPSHTPDNITYLRDDEVFVFGSNAEGRHNGGAAKTAVELFGAVTGQGEGIQGQSYALPSMGSLLDIKRSLKTFHAYAKTNPDKWFYLTKVGTGIAGHSKADITYLLPKKKPANIIYPKGWL